MTNVEAAFADDGGVILDRALPFLDGRAGFDIHNARLNANNKAATAVLNNLRSGSFVGYEFNGRKYRVPEFIEALRNPNSGNFDIGKCSYMVSVVTGRPVAP
jgi:hypothetical protein